MEIGGEIGVRIAGGRITPVELDAYITLSCLDFLTTHEETALNWLNSYLSLVKIVKLVRYRQFIWQI